MPNISVIISTWNNSERLRITLESFCDLDLPSEIVWELVVVDNNSTDNTNDVVQSFADRLPLVHIFEPRPGLSNGRNAGVSASAAPFLVFTDDDVVPCRTWLIEYWNAFQSSSPSSFFGGPVESDFESPADPELLELAPNSVRGLDFGAEPRALRAGESFLAANWACTKEALLDAGGFDPNRGLDPTAMAIKVGEETHLMKQMCSNGIVPHYVPTASLKHFVPQAKVSRKHIMSRIEAAGYEFERRQERARPRLLNMYVAQVRVCRWGVRWWLARFAAPNRELRLYRSFRFCVGMARAARGLVL